MKPDMSGMRKKILRKKKHNPLTVINLNLEGSVSLIESFIPFLL